MAFEWHRKLEANQLTLAVLAFVVVTIGGLVLLIPPYFLQGTIVPIPGVTPYTALEVEGRDIYVREGCYTCHSQQVRPFKTETDRYGPYSLAGESVYDRPFQFGSRRTGPDLARVGGKYPDSWHWIHLRNPREIEAQSNMPAFAYLLETPLDVSLTRRKLEVLRRLGTPYDDATIEGAEAAALAQLDKMAGVLRAGGVSVSDVGARSEGMALIAYLQKLGTGIDWRNKPATTAQTAEVR